MNFHFLVDWKYHPNNVIFLLILDNNIKSRIGYHLFFA